MPVTLIGVVYYEDDPEKKVFRVVYPQYDNKELEEPPHNALGEVYLDDQGQPCSWCTLGTDPNRKAKMEKIPFAKLSDWKQGSI